MPTEGEVIGQEFSMAFEQPLFIQNPLPCLELKQNFILGIYQRWWKATHQRQWKATLALFVCGSLTAHQNQDAHMLVHAKLMAWKINVLEYHYCSQIHGSCRMCQLWCIM